MNWKLILIFIVVVTVLGGCATVPTGPSVMVLPAPGKSFGVFQSDDITCRQWALQQAGVPPSKAVNEKLAGGAAIGTLVGAGLGAMIGAASGNAGAGAAIGAGSGLLGGTAMASGPAYAAGWEVQRRYDIAYQQCMYAKGNQIPDHKQTSSRAYPVPPPPPGFNRRAPVPFPSGTYPSPPPP
jgi:uncharacterized protein YceK